VVSFDEVSVARRRSDDGEPAAVPDRDRRPPELDEDGDEDGDDSASTLSSLVLEPALLLRRRLSDGECPDPADGVDRDSGEPAVGTSSEGTAGKEEMETASRTGGRRSGDAGSVASLSPSPLGDHLMLSTPSSRRLADEYVSLVPRSHAPLSCRRRSMWVMRPVDRSRNERETQCAFDEGRRRNAPCGADASSASAA